MIFTSNNVDIPYSFHAFITVKKVIMLILNILFIVQVLDHPMINLSKEEIRESMEETLG